MFDGIIIHKGIIHQILLKAKMKFKDKDEYFKQDIRWNHKTIEYYMQLDGSVLESYHRIV